jgi:hypothetical protein
MLPVGQTRDSTPSGVIRARMLSVVKFNALQGYYDGIPRLGGTALEMQRHPRQAGGAKDRPRPKLTPAQERARLRVSSRVIARHNPKGY